MHILKYIQIKHPSPLHKINAFPIITLTRFYYSKRFFNILTYFAIFGFKIKTFSQLAILPIRVIWRSGYYSWFESQIKKIIYYKELQKLNKFHV